MVHENIYKVISDEYISPDGQIEHMWLYNNGDFKDQFAPFARSYPEIEIKHEPLYYYFNVSGVGLSVDYARVKFYELALSGATLEVMEEDPEFPEMLKLFERDYVVPIDCNYEDRHCDGGGMGKGEGECEGGGDGEGEGLARPGKGEANGGAAGNADEHDRFIGGKKPGQCKLKCLACKQGGGASVLRLKGFGRSDTEGDSRWIKGQTLPHCPTTCPTIHPITTLPRAAHQPTILVMAL